MITIDGARGEGGGQVLRTALGLAALTGRARRVENIRARRPKPGLMRQHLTSARAAAAICDGELVGDEIGSRAIELRPGRLRAGAHRFDIGSAGSTSLVLQTVLPGLLRAAGTSEVTILGGTHNPLSPPFEFLSATLLPHLARMGHRASLTLVRHGFLPAGGGEVRATIVGGATTTGAAAWSLVDRGVVRRPIVRALVAEISGQVAVREIEALRAALGDLELDARPEVVRGSRGPGNAIVAWLESDASTEVVTAFGEKGRLAEAVARDLASQIRRYLDVDAPVGEHLADQLVIPLALARGGTFRTSAPSLHLRTQIELVAELLGVRIDATDEGDGRWLVTVAACA